VDKIADVSQARPGDEFTYYISVLTSQETERTVTLEDTLVPQLQLVSVSPAELCNVSEKVVTCSLQVVNGNPAQVSIMVRTADNPTLDTIVSNQAWVRGEGEVAASEVVRVRVYDYSEE
jgi:hypothetical protein